MKYYYYSIHMKILPSIIDLSTPKTDSRIVQQPPMLHATSEKTNESNKIKENGHHHHSEVYLNSQFDLYEDGTSVDGEDHVDYNEQHDNEVSYVVQNGMNGELS